MLFLNGFIEVSLICERNCNCISIMAPLHLIILRGDFDEILINMHMGNPDMGPTWDPLGTNFHYDFHISFNNSYTNISTLNEYES